MVGSPDSMTVHDPIQVGSLTYFVPDMADAVGVFDAATREYTQVETWQNTNQATMTRYDQPTMTHP